MDKELEHALLMRALKLLIASAGELTPAHQRDTHALLTEFQTLNKRNERIEATDLPQPERGTPDQGGSPLPGVAKDVAGASARKSQGQPVSQRRNAACARRKPRKMTRTTKLKYEFCDAA